MSDANAFEEEMQKDVNNFLDAVRAQLSEQPDPRLGTELVRRLAATARAEHVTRESTTVARSRRRLGALGRPAVPAGIALAALGLILSTAGLALAGVSLPGPIDTSFRTVGIDLPNQGPGDGVDPASETGGAPLGEGAGAKGSTQESANGGEGNSKAQGEGKLKTPGPSGNANGHRGSGSPGNSGSAVGRIKAKGLHASSRGGSGENPKPPKPAPPEPAPPGQAGDKSS